MAYCHIHLHQAPCQVPRYIRRAVVVVVGVVVIAVVVEVVGWWRHIAPFFGWCRNDYAISSNLTPLSLLLPSYTLLTSGTTTANPPSQSLARRVPLPQVYPHLWHPGKKLVAAAVVVVAAARASDCGAAEGPGESRKIIYGHHP